MNNANDKVLYAPAARLAWDAYAEASGGKTYDGKPLPTWQELGYKKQAAWMAAARAAMDYAANNNSND